MIYIAVAMVVISGIAFQAFRLHLESKKPAPVQTALPAEQLAALAADIEKCKLALKIKTFSGGN